MTKKEAIKVIEIIEKRFITLDKEELQALDMAIKALENEPRFLVHSDGKIEQIIEPCDDAVSRQAVLDAIDNNKHSTEYCKDHNIDYNIDVGVAHCVINDLPPVQPKREQGEWIVKMDCEGKTRTCICPKCGEKTGKYTWENPNYCSNCGAEMR